MPNTREKLIELLKTVQHSGVVYQQSQMDERKYNAKQIHNIDVADHLIANGVTVQEWIPVTERLPEKDGDYLIYATVPFNGRKFIAATYYEKGTYQPIWSDTSHWMPLPQPPKGD